MSLRAQSLVGALFLALREGVGIAIRLVGVLLLTRLLGPDQYGLYAGAAVAVSVLAGVVQLGAEVWLIRRPEEPSSQLYAQVASVLLVISTGVLTVGLALVALCAAVLDGARFTAPLALLLLSVPVNVLWAPAQAKIERAFDYRKMAVLEVGGDLVLYGVAVPLAALGAGVWAPVAGYLAWQTWLLIGSYVAARLRPRWMWSTAVAKDLARFGSSYNAATWMGLFTQLVNPVVVGAFAGAAAVGQVALALRLVDTLGFVLRAVWRLTNVSIARVQDDIARLRRGAEDVMTLQLLALGPVLIGVALAGPWLIPAVFGEEWRPAADVYPLLAVGALVQALNDTQVSILLIKNAPAGAVVSTATRVVIFTLAALALVPPLGIRGYGLAELCASVSLLAIARAARRVVPGLSYRPVMPWLAAFVPVLILAGSPVPAGVRLASLLMLVLVLLAPSPRRQLVGHVRFVRSTLSRRSPRGSEDVTDVQPVSSSEGSS